MDIGRSWNILEKILSIEKLGGCESRWASVHVDDELKDAVLFLASPGMSDLLQEWLYETIFQDLNKRVGPAFWEIFSTVTTDPGVNREAFSQAFELLYGVYSSYYTVALKRLRWLQVLAASAPKDTLSQNFISSAFTPVKTGAGNQGKGVQFGGPANQNKVLSSSFGGSRSERTGVRGGMSRLSVTFEKGTKGSTTDEEMADDSMEARLDDMAGSSRLRLGSMDGSYVGHTPHQRPVEHSLWSDSSTQSHAPVGELDLDSSHPSSHFSPTKPVFDEDDDFESFIRSPIGGNKKLMAAARQSDQTPGSVSFATPAFVPRGGAKSSDGESSVSTMKTKSLTSTPGFSLKETPGPITPITFQETPQSCSKWSTSRLTSGQGDQEKMDSASEGQGDGFSDVTTSLPDASQVFGVPVSTRPMPGGYVKWVGAGYWKSSLERITLMLKAVLFKTMTKNFVQAVRDFYTEAFHIHKTEMENSGLEEDMQKILERSNDINRKVDEMGLMELVSGSAVTEIVHSQIEKHINEECRGNFDTSFLPDLEEWLDQNVLGWLNRIYASKQTAPQLASVDAFRDRLRHFIYETYAKSLISQFFDIIIDYPDSKPAIVDLKACLERTDLRSELVTSLKSALENRLLHPGVNTADILTAYIAAIKSLRLLEPAGVILELVCEPVGRYLRSREDTVRCIVASLTDEGNNELVSELVKTKPSGEENEEEDGNMKDWEDWMPDPVDADPSSVSKSRRSADILSTLVNIYGSKELFVNEYRALLADRILMQYNYDVERELRYLELLKLRFGEAQLHFCEVMLRDVTESRRVNSRIQDARRANADGGETVDMNAMILSAQFWPAFRDEKIKLPKELQEHMDKYTRSFELQKQNRTLVWKQHLGMMNIELELKDETLNFSVSPVQAAIIMKFQEKTKWSVEELCSELEMTATLLRRKIAFWQGQGLLRETSTDVYELVEEKRGRPHDLIMVDEEEMESAMASAQQQKEEEMQMCWTYIQGMLANLECLTLERIHSMLKMFAQEESGSTEVSLQELKGFLDNKVKDQILIFSGGVYRLNK